MKVLKRLKKGKYPVLFVSRGKGTAADLKWASSKSMEINIYIPCNGCGSEQLLGIDPAIAIASLCQFLRARLVSCCYSFRLTCSIFCSPKGVSVPPSRHIYIICKIQVFAFLSNEA